MPVDALRMEGTLGAVMPSGAGERFEEKPGRSYHFRADAAIER
jgi:hypothetical protein